MHGRSASYVGVKHVDMHDGSHAYHVFKLLR
jgi:hypothetical protein